MKTNRRTFVISGAAGAWGLSMPPAHAADWPARGQAIRLIVPYAAGGTTDILGRLMAEGISRELGVPVIPDNVPGANGNLGVAQLVRAKPDGYTLMLGTPGPMVVNKYVYDKTPFDPLQDIAPVALVATLPNVLVVRPNMGVNTVAEFVALARSRNGRLSHGSPGIGSSSHVSAELFKLAAGIKATHIPYKGSLPMLTDLIGGTVDFTIDQVSSAFPFIQGGQLKPLAVTSGKRSAELPAVPTLKESGYPDYEVSVWFCIGAPARVPADIILRVNKAINNALAYPEVKARIQSFAATPLGGSPDDLARQIQAEQKNILNVLKVVDLKS